MRSKAKKRPRTALVIIKSSLIAAIVSIVLIVLFAVLLYNGALGEDSISIVNTLIKILGSAFTAFLAVRSLDGNRFMYGGIAGIAYIVLSFIVFSVISSKFSFTLGLLSDLGMGLLSGMLTGLLYQTLAKASQSK